MTIKMTIGVGNNNVHQSDEHLIVLKVVLVELILQMELGVTAIVTKPQKQLLLV